MKDPNYLINLEKAIIETYGEETVRNPKFYWNEEKEKDYLKQLKDVYSVKTDSEGSDMVNQDGILIPKRLFKKENNKVCVSCKHYSFDRKDDIYLNKYKTCFKCYINYVEFREEKWLAKIYPEKNQ